MRRTSPASARANPLSDSNSKIGRSSRGKWGADPAVCGVVVISSVTVFGLAPGVTVADGEKEADAPAGNGVDGDKLNVTGLGNVPFDGDRVKTKFAVCPAVTGGDELGGVTE